MKRLFEYFLLMTALLFADGANAGVTITFAQSGSDVVATATGTFTLPSGTLQQSSISGAIWPYEGRLIFAGGGNVASNIFCPGGITSTAGQAAFGSGPVPIYSSNSTGQVFGIRAFSSLVYVPSGFTSGGSINSTVTFSNITLASLGLDSGNTVYTCGTDTITIVGPSTPAPIPTLSEWAQFIMMLMMIGTVGWYTRRMFR